MQQEGRRVEAVLDKKERSSKGKTRDEQKELRKERKQGRKRVITCAMQRKIYKEKTDVF